MVGSVLLGTAPLAHALGVSSAVLLLGVLMALLLTVGLVTHRGAVSEAG